jgi:hypothetical protein
MLKNQNDTLKQGKEQLHHLQARLQHTQHRSLEYAWQLAAKQLQVTLLSSEGRQQMSLPELYQTVSELNLKLASSQSRANKLEKMIANKSA